MVGGFNPFEKYLSKWESSPSRDENKKYLEPPTRLYSSILLHQWIFVPPNFEHTHLLQATGFTYLQDLTTQ